MMNGRRLKRSRAIGAATIFVLLFSGVAYCAEEKRSDRFLAFDATASMPLLEIVQTSTDGFPRAAFQQGESASLQVQSEKSGELFALLVDSHGVLSLAGSSLDGWMGQIEATSASQHEVIGPQHWANGLPLGDTMVSVYLVSSAGRRELSAGLQGMTIEKGIVADASVHALADLLDALSTNPREGQGIQSAGRTQLTFIHPKPPRGRGLGMRTSTPTAQVNLIERESIIGHFTGPRSRSISRVRLDLYIRFEFDSASILPDARRQIEEMAAALKDPRMQSLAFRIGGHTDRVGAHSYNFDLSRSRARAVQELLIAQHDIESARLIASGFADDHLLDTSGSEEAAATNRRVDLQLRRD